MLPHSRVLIHQPHGGASGQAVDIEIQAKEIIRMREALDSIVAHHTGQDVDKVARDTDRDFIMSATEARTTASSTRSSPTASYVGWATLLAADGRGGPTVIEGTVLLRT